MQISRDRITPTPPNCPDPPAMRAKSPPLTSPPGSPPYSPSLPPSSPASPSPEADSSVLEAPEVLAAGIRDLESQQHVEGSRQQPTQTTQATQRATQGARSTPTGNGPDPGDKFGRALVVAFFLTLVSALGANHDICHQVWMHVDTLNLYFWSLLPAAISICATCAIRYHRCDRALCAWMSTWAVDLLPTFVALMVGLWYYTPLHPASSCPTALWHPRTKVGETGDAVASASEVVASLCSATATAIITVTASTLASASAPASTGLASLASNITQVVSNSSSVQL